MQLSNIAKQYDKDYASYEKAQLLANQIVENIRKISNSGKLKPGQIDSAAELLRRFHDDPLLFLINAPGGGATPEMVLTDNGRHGMDGARLPFKEELAPALATRSQTMADLKANWPKLTPSEQESRRQVIVGPNSSMSARQ